METVATQPPITEDYVDIHVVNFHATRYNGDNITLPEGVVPFVTSGDRATDIGSLLARMWDEGHQRYRLHVHGGDGTASMAIETAVRSGLAIDVRLEDGPGNKKDLAAMTRKNGGQTALRPLVLERQVADGKFVEERIVSYTFGLGAVAAGADIANSKADFRDPKAEQIELLVDKGLPRRLAEFCANKVADFKLVRKLLPPTVVIDGVEYPTHVIINGRKVGAYMASNGQFTSGGSLRFPWNRLDKPGFGIAEINYGRSSKLLGAVALPVTALYATGSTGPLRLESADGKRIRAQADGDSLELEHGNTYRLREYGETLVTLSVADKTRRKTGKVALHP